MSDRVYVEELVDMIGKEFVIENVDGDITEIHHLSFRGKNGERFWLEFKDGYAVARWYDTD